MSIYVNIWWYECKKTLKKFQLGKEIFKKKILCRRPTRQPSAKNAVSVTAGGVFADGWCGRRQSFADGLTRGHRQSRLCRCFLCRRLCGKPSAKPCRWLNRLCRWQLAVGKEPGSGSELRLSEENYGSAFSYIIYI
jgi:hypothetical protein